MSICATYEITRQTVLTLLLAGILNFMAMNFGAPSQIKWGDWQSMPDYREGWKDKNKSAVVGIIRALDLTQKLPVIGEASKFIHEGEDRVMTGINRVLAPIMKFENETGGKIDPIRQTLSKVAPEQHKNYIDWFTNHGADVAAIAAASYFTGGAAANAVGGGGGAAGGGAASTAGGAGGTSSLGAAGSSAITPVFSSGAAGAGTGAGTAGSTTGSLVGAGAITPAFAGGASTGGIAGASGLGTLGTAGTQAALAAITPAFAGGAATPSALSQVYNALKRPENIRSNINTLRGTDSGPTDTDRMRNQKMQIAELIYRNGQQPQPNDRFKRLSQQIFANRFYR